MPRRDETGSGIPIATLLAIQLALHPVGPRGSSLTSPDILALRVLPARLDFELALPL